MGASILDDFGEEVTGIVYPVSVCMVITVALVRVLNPEGASDSGAVYLASAYYTERESDSAGTKLTGSVINALIFVGAIAAMTFILVLLFKYGCTKLIYGYMGFSGFSIFFVLTGLITLELLQTYGAELDWISFTYMLFNFAVVGATTLFFFPAPLLMKQCYLIVTGVAVAYVFTWIPEWTTWVLLLAMAAYDVCAVLVPGGPLRVLVELAQERDEDIPALVYQARPSRRNGGVNVQQAMVQPAMVEMTPHSSPAESAADSEPPPALEQDPSTPLINPADSRYHESDRPHLRLGAGTVLSHEDERELELHPNEATAFSLPEAIKLGLGDFIFYSVLVGRAAMYDWLTVFACYLAIIAGLGCTLLWLALAKHALPALPVSIVLAVAFYFISRFVMEPVILPMTLHLIYF